MGRLLDVTCRQCAHVSRQLEGPLMTGFLPRCHDCGRTTSVTLEELMADDPPELHPASDEAWELRYQRMSRIAGPCVCGGAFDRHAPLRCGECRSTDVSTVEVGRAD